MKPQLVIDFISLMKNPIFTEFEMFGKRKPIQMKIPEVLDIPDDYFDGEYWKMTSLKLLSEEVINECVLQIYKNINHCYCFCDDIGKTYHLLFNETFCKKKNSEEKNEKEKLEVNQEEKIKINIPSCNLELDKYDTNDNKYRKRIILVNATSTYIKINKVGINLSEFIKDFNGSSYQLSVYNLQKRIIVTKMLEISKPNESFENIYNNNSSLFNNFIKDFKDALKDEKEFEIKFSNLYNNYKNTIYPKYFLNISRKKIENELNNEKYIDFFYNMLIFKIYSEHIKGSEKNFKTVSSFMTFLNEKIESLKNDENLKIYQKILLIEQYGHILNKMTPDSFLKSDINYYIMDKIEKNSILDIVKKFFNDYINSLNEDSNIFFKLLEIDSGVGYFKEKKIFCFDMTNIEEIKAHLKDIFIETLITYKLKKKICAFIVCKTGAIAINLMEIPNNEKFFFESELKPYEMVEGKDIAAKIIVFLLHEIFGHKKFLYGKEQFITSPFYFYNNNKIYFLDYIRSLSKSNDAIKILSDKSRSDEGTYYELSYGKIGDYFTVEIIDKMDGYGDLLDDINLWINDLDVINDYFKYKYIIVKKNIDTIGAPNSIREKVNYYKNLVVKTKIDVESFYKKIKEENNTLLGKKRNPDNKEYSKNEKELNQKIDFKSNKDNDIEEIDEDVYLDFDSMPYEELIELYYSGKLKGDFLIECHKRISAYEIIPK